MKRGSKEWHTKNLVLHLCVRDDEYLFRGQALLYCIVCRNTIVLCRRNKDFQSCDGRGMRRIIVGHQHRIAGNIEFELCSDVGGVVQLSANDGLQMISCLVHKHRNDELLPSMGQFFWTRWKCQPVSKSHRYHDDN